MQLEFWRFGDEEIEAPQPNALMRPRLPRGEAVEAEVELYGRRWRTLQHMFDPLASDVAFDIDMVFSWVDGSSAEYQRQRAARMSAYVVGDGDDNEARYRQIDELKYALRSIYMFAPWVRNIYIATDSPAPHWLAEHPRVRLMRSADFFADQDALPTHNSHAVESQLHHIPGLSEHFLYSNDDMFFGRPLSPDLFFSPGGVTKFVEAGTRIGLGESDPARSGFENAARVNRRLLWERFGAVTTRHLEHCAAPLRVSVLREMEEAFPEDFARTAASAFRSATDISVTNSLYHYYALMSGRAVTQTQAKVQYIETTLRQAPEMMKRLLKRRDQDMFCLNDGSKPEIGAEERTRIVIDFLERYFPFPAPWEKDAAAPASLSDGSAPSLAGSATTAAVTPEG
jgi:UDP-glucose 4-epimerase